MLSRRWIQFNLRFLFATLLAVACMAWWFRPGIIKPEFALDGFSSEADSLSGAKRVGARIRLTNSGPDAITVSQGPTYFVNLLEKWKKVEGTEDEWETQGGRAGTKFSSYDPPIRLRSGESTVFAVDLEKDDRDIQLAVEIRDRRGSREKTFWSPRFPIPDNLFVSK